MLRPAHGVKLNARPVRLARRCVLLIDFHKFLFGRPADLGNEFRGITGILLFQKLEHTVGILKAHILFDHPVRPRLIGPGVLVVLIAFQA